MRRLNLCFVGPASSISLRRWVNWFAEKGHTCTVMTVEPADDLDGSAFCQIDLSCRGAGWKSGRLISALRLARAVSRLKPDLVHAHYVRGFAWGLLAAPARPVVATPWGSDVLAEQGAFRDWYGGILTKRLLQRAALVTTHSRYMETRIRQLVPNPSAMVRIGWGVDLQRFRPGLDTTELRRRWKVDDGRAVIFSPRLAQPFYHHDLIVRALPEVCRQVPHALLVIPEHFADGAYVRSLQCLAAELGVSDQVRFVGALEYEAMPYWYNLASAVVMVPSSDGMPNSLLEAMACGTVPILRRLPQYEELIEEQVNGRYVDPHEGSLAEVLAETLLTPSFRASCSRANRALAESEADQEQEMSRMESLYYCLSGL